MKTKVLFYLLGLWSLTTYSQLVLEHTYNEHIAARVQLENSGEKYYMYNPGTSAVDFFNADHSFWKSVPIITTPNIFSFRICHVSENTLDDDPDIDIAYAFYTMGDPGARSYIVNEDGSVALDLPGCVYYRVNTLSDNSIKIVAEMANGARVYSAETFTLEQVFAGSTEYHLLAIWGDIYSVFDAAQGKIDFYTSDYTLWKSMLLPKPADAAYTRIWVFSEHDINEDDLIEVSYGYVGGGEYHALILNENNTALLEVPDAFRIFYDAPADCTPKVKVELAGTGPNQGQVLTQFYSVPALQLEHTYEGYAGHLALEMSGEVFYDVHWEQMGTHLLNVYDAGHALWKALSLPVPDDMFDYSYQFAGVTHLSETVFDDEPDLEVIYSFYEDVLLEQKNYTTNVIDETGAILNTIPLASGMYLSTGNGWDPKFIASMTYGMLQNPMGQVDYFTSVWDIGGMAGLADHYGPVSLYPNPVADRLTIATSGRRFVQAEIFDLAGRRLTDIYENDIRQVDFSRLPNGSALLKLTDASGTSITRKILKRENSAERGHAPRGIPTFAAMFQLGKTIVSEDILEKEFVCNLSACHGACCVDGDAGAPLLESETRVLEEIYDKVKPFLRPEGIAAVEAQGTWVTGTDGTLETPLIDNKDCAYVIFDGKTALCGIEQAYNQGLINWKKPVSCHLYPVRVKDFSEFAAVNYDRWDICDPACALGTELEVPVYKFVKEALIRRFGEDWYLELEKVAEELKEG